MNAVVARYGLKPVKRPKIKVTRELDLSDDIGRDIIRSKTKLVLRVHKKLADM